ncbi:AAA family ATPase [Nocardia jiangsuensis]|uniref:AAA family ATPase n=1 Tax=Nocardia jiangsuensis TaxID=1691563 RepID=A0ABV8E2Y2_9NOCA
MLVWINGAFGAGKTQTAFELHRRLANSHVADPELIGYGIHRMLPRSARGDFQDHPQWRSAVAATLADVVAVHPGPVLVPMTLVRAQYFDEIMDALAESGAEVRHFALLAAPEVLRHRLSTRLEALFGSGESWAMRQIDRCVAALTDDRFASHIATDHLTVDEVVETIAHSTGLELVNPRLGAARHRLRRLAVAAQHIRR